jgi:hypothetical protein
MSKQPTFDVEDPKYGLKARVLLCMGPYQKIDKPTVEFYDTDYPHTAHGQFTGGGYYLETLLEDQDTLRERGLNLHGGIPKWTLGPRAMNEVLDWIEQQVNALDQSLLQEDGQ